MRAAALTLTAILILAFSLPALERQPPIKLPWMEAGLSEREAAAHLLNRFAYGPRPGEVEAVVKMGLGRWLERQLSADLPDKGLERRLDGLPALEMSASEIARTYPPPGLLLLEARRAGVIQDLDVRELSNVEEGDKRERRAAVLRWAGQQGYRSQRELAGQLMAQKLWRAVESENQLAEVMTDFWFSHFNVSMTDNQSRGHLLSYERDAIRPNALGEVRDLLGATARHPAMLLYLDNARSNSRRGLNENYARELLELHTLGVDGGYSQQDVVEVARAFTGWSVQVRDGSFVFRRFGHDSGAKTVLGKKLPGHGIGDGEAVLDLLAVHPSTAKHLATKLAVRFVSDKPSPALVDRLAAVYLKSGGEVRPVLRAIAESPDFWGSVGDKIKSPFELAASAVRGLDGDVRDPRETLRRIADMGQKLYAYQAPTGYPDRAEAWVSTGSLASRMSFGLDLAAGKVRGVDFELAPATGSREEVLRAWGERLLPGRDLKPALALIEPKIESTRPEQVAGVILGSPEFQRR
ncbi:MAG TPA: DUF1800 domain-containing protein [Thermoanaerobaculia bacterium]|nr:DUF1800 domain-containing protein [Thermoanaerobaculia bacterium]